MDGASAVRGWKEIDDARRIPVVDERYSRHPSASRLIIVRRDEYYAANKAVTRYGNSSLGPVAVFSQHGIAFNIPAAVRQEVSRMTLKALSSAE